MKIREGHSEAHIFKDNLISRDHVLRITLSYHAVYRGNSHILVLLAPRVNNYNLNARLMESVDSEGYHGIIPYPSVNGFLNGDSATPWIFIQDVN